MAKTPPVATELDLLRAGFPEVTECSDDRLASMWAAVMLRMRDVELVRGHGSVPGELAETLIARWYDGDLSPQSTADVDVITPRQRRIQVKALRFTDPKRGSVSAFTRTIAFDELAIVCFEYDMRVREALILDAENLRVTTPESPGLLTPKGLRLSLGPRVREVATIIPGDQLWTQGGGHDHDRDKAMA